MLSCYGEYRAYEQYKTKNTYQGQTPRHSSSLREMSSRHFKHHHHNTTTTYITVAQITRNYIKRQNP